MFPELERRFGNRSKVGRAEVWAKRKTPARGAGFFKADITGGALSALLMPNNLSSAQLFRTLCCGRGFFVDALAQCDCV